MKRTTAALTPNQMKMLEYLKDTGINKVFNLPTVFSQLDKTNVKDYKALRESGYFIPTEKGQYITPLGLAAIS